MCVCVCVCVCVLALNYLQELICFKTQPTNQSIFMFHTECFAFLIRFSFSYIVLIFMSISLPFDKLAIVVQC